MRYTHDCDACKPLGEFGNADLYFCAQLGIPTVIARFSSDGPDYTSGMEFAKSRNDLAEAKKRAIAAGHLQGAQQ